jgi:beta-mannosidase
MEILLSENPWFVKGYWPWVPLKDKSMETGKTLIGTTDWIPATVPGGVHYDLYRAGLIEHPYFEMNSLKCEWVENRWWMYRTVFDKPNETGEKYELVFKGIDYEAIFYLNGHLLGEHKGMYQPAKFDVTRYMHEREQFELIVVFKHPPDEIGQIGNTSKTFTQKSRFNYKWDFSTRIVNIGFWDDVYLKIHQKAMIGDVSLLTDVGDGKGTIKLSIGIEYPLPAASPLLMDVVCHHPDGLLAYHQEVRLDAGEEQSDLLITIGDPKLWFPNGHGEQALYTVSIRLKEGNKILDKREYHTGIRQLRYMQNENSPQDALPYTVVINGKKVYIKGFNMTPLDHLYGTVTPEHYEFLIKKIKRANGNMVRVWGGGIIEKGIFYELCDRHGIMVWQEFIQSSSGIDNIPSKRPELLALLKETAVTALKEKRNHVSLTVWSGGNELMDENFTPSTYGDENISMLKELVETYDPTRLFLPTSASGPVEFVTKKKGVSHDIHGHWQYAGNPSHYQLYGESDSLFHSEFGTDGVSSLKSLRKFLSVENLIPTTMSNNMVWRHHGEWWGTYNRDQDLFGPIEDISLFVDCSQWIQAEGIRFILEANRRREFHNSGSLIWQLNEPWPNASCTNIVDYYGEEKMAFHWARIAFAPLHVSLDYRSLNCKMGEFFQAPVFLHGNGEKKKIVVRSQVLTLKGQVLKETSLKVEIMPFKASKVFEEEFLVSKEHGELFFIRLQLIEDGRVFHENLYTFSTKESQVYSKTLTLNVSALSVKDHNDWTNENGVFSKDYRIINEGSHAALHIHPVETSNGFWMEASDSYFTLFPGESRTCTINCYPKAGGGFLKDDQAEREEPVIMFDQFASSIKHTN